MAESAGDDRDLRPDPASRRRGLIFVVAFATIVVAVVVGSLLLIRHNAERSRQELTYNGFGFTPVQQGGERIYVTKVQVGGQPYDIPFYTHPRDTERVAMESGITDRFVKPGRQPKQVYLTFPADGGSMPILAGVEVSRITGERYGILNIPTKGALQSQPASNQSQLPVVTCADASENVSVLSFGLGSHDIISADKANPWCIRLEYTTPNESVRVADRFAYGLLRIMSG